jgi:cbb3-type cytochrome oxidase maturation protein
MLIIVGLILISLGLAIGFLWAFIWAVNNGQFDDTETPARRALFDNTYTEKEIKKTK